MTAEYALVFLLVLFLSLLPEMILGAVLAVRRLVELSREEKEPRGAYAVRVGERVLAFGSIPEAVRGLSGLPAGTKVEVVRGNGELRLALEEMGLVVVAR